MGYEFEEIKRAVTAEEAARFYGLEVNSRSHRAKCPFHGGERENLSFHGLGYRCFVCGASGSVLDFTVGYLHLPSTLEAAKRLDRDFNLRLFDRPERKQSGVREDLDRKLQLSFSRWCMIRVKEYFSQASSLSAALRGTKTLSNADRGRMRARMKSAGRVFALIRRYIIADQDRECDLIDIPIFHAGPDPDISLALSEREEKRLYRLYAEDRKVAEQYCEEWKRSKSPAMRADVLRIREVYALD
ncbi:MAG: hypothetical protein IJH70_11545 [Oscillospiraceae bacterium]|nr:hypothetical protein [Oscillospiraceae bacterium]